MQKEINVLRDEYGLDSSILYKLATTIVREGYAVSKTEAVKIACLILDIAFSEDYVREIRGGKYPKLKVSENILAYYEDLFLEA